jgi:uncharacterized protein (TIGR03382 family)
MYALLLAANLIVANETVVHDTTTNVDLTLDESTVLCSSADYGALFLKVLIPQLAQLTLLDHQNTGAGAPCVASGLCEAGNEPSDIIDSSDPNETVAVNVKAVRQDMVDTDAQTCDTYLIERVNVTIRGIAFTHERTAPLGSRAYSDCVTSQPATDDPDDPPSTDDPDAMGEPAGDEVSEPGGGCSTTGGSGSLAGLVLVGLALAGRRRRR